MDGSEAWLQALENELLYTVACEQCSKKLNAIDVQLLRTDTHCCNGNILLVKSASGKISGSQNSPQNSGVWKMIRRRPTRFQPHRYFLCWHASAREGCLAHRARCTFAWSVEEAAVWNFEKRHKCTQAQMIQSAREKLSKAKSKKSALAGAAPDQDTISPVAIKHMDEFGGEFKEVCCRCFYSLPPMISEGACCCTTVHWPWRALLVHVTKTARSVCYHEVRTLNKNSKFTLCPYAAKQHHCPKRQLCPNAHNEVEMSVWKAEMSNNLNRAHLLKLSKQMAPVEKSTASPADKNAALAENIYCCFCFVTCDSQEQFDAHITSARHKRMISMDSDLDWQYRSPPLNVINQCYRTCARGEECELGRDCPEAHSPEELQEWRRRVQLRHSRVANARELGLQPYRERLLDKYASSPAEVSVIAEKVNDATVECNTSLKRTCQPRHNLSWTFTVTSKGPLMHVALLRSDPDISFHLVGRGLGETCVEAKGDVFMATPVADPGKYQNALVNPHEGGMHCGTASHHATVRVSFKATRYGSYHQWLVFDFGNEPVLKKELHVEVVDAAVRAMDSGNKTDLPETHIRWHSGNRTIISLREYSADDQRLLARYKSPAVTLDPLASRPLPSVITPDNYQQSLHTALYREEAAQEMLLSRLNLQTEVVIKKMIIMPTGMILNASQGMLYAEVPVPLRLSQDSEEGLLLQRSVDVALIALPGSEDGSPVYEASVSKDLFSAECLRLLLPQSVCLALKLSDNTRRTLDVQFALNHLRFCIQHAAVDHIDASLILPNVTNCALPMTSPDALPATLKGNAKQKKVIMFAVGERMPEKPTPPFIIYGPFGTGKTYTLFQATVHILAKPNTRVLICTQTNSAADLYIQEYFHELVTSGFKEATPFRLIYKWRKINTVRDVVRQYCCVDPSGRSFEVPRPEVVAAHRVVITTYTESHKLWQLGLTRGYFSHILLDEAAQAMETESLIPLALADRGTRVLLAGDHKQITPKCYSVPNDDKKFVIRTLLQRLFYHYQQQNHNTAQCSRIIMTDNYRSRPEIVNFVSKHFYLGNHDKDFKGIQARADIARHPSLYPLTFSHVSGKCDFDNDTRTWRNVSEALEVAERVADILQTWPETQGRLEQTQICVISYYASQVSLIRSVLRKNHLGSVTVDRLQNIQGKEFTVIVLSTVRTRASWQCDSTDRNLGFLEDTCALNTAMTRARALVLAVGDAVTLCSVGGCSRVWRSFLREAHVHGSMIPPSMVPEDIAESIAEMAMLESVARQQQLTGSNVESWNSGGNDEIDALNDPILSELLDESKGVYMLTTEDGYTTISEVKNSEETNASPPTDPVNAEITSGNKHIQHRYIHHSEETLQELLTKMPDIYKRCEIVIQSHGLGYGIPKDGSVPLIYLHSRVNIGKSFSGDEVVIEILNTKAEKQSQKSATNYKGRVVGVLHQDIERHDRVLCGVDLYDANIMIPVDKCMPKIYNPPIKRQFYPNRNKVAVRETNSNGRKYYHVHLTYQNRTSKLFLVKIEKWRRELPYPLGIVYDVLPDPKDISGQLEKLDQINVSKNSHHSTRKWTYQQDRTINDGKDCRKIYTFTVDPSDAILLDDAISVEDFGDSFRIGVHVADVQRLECVDDDVDSGTREQGGTIPKPPRHLLQRCNLLPNEDRPAFSLFFTVEKCTGITEKLETVFEQTIIQSKRRIDYSEADIIISQYKSMPMNIEYEEDNIAVAFFFSQMLRQRRLHAGALYVQPNENWPNDRSHVMIEELMITTNYLVAQKLLENENTADITPLKHQPPPLPEDLDNFKREYKSVIPLSLNLSSILFSSIQGIENLKTSTHLEFMHFIWEKMKEAIKNEDSHRLFTLIAQDDMHPFLVAAVKEFGKIQLRANIARSRPPSTGMDHCSLKLPFYTKSTSPMRHDIDLVVQRLLAATSQKERPLYTPEEMDCLCRGFNKDKNNSAHNERVVNRLKFSGKLIIQGEQKLALISSINEQNKYFTLVFPFDNTLLPDYYNVNFQSLQLSTQPVFGQDDNGRKTVAIQWRTRMYSVKSDRNEIPNKLKKQSITEVCTVRSDSWKQVLLAAKENNFYKASMLIQEEDRHMKATSAKRSSTSPPKNHDKLKDHFSTGKVVLKTGTPITVQLGVRVRGTFMSPEVQLLSLKKDIPDLCLEHAEDPVSMYKCHTEKCTKTHYNNVKTYQAIWAPLSAMESVTVAVNEHNSIMLHDIKIVWRNSDDGAQLQGEYPSIKKVKLEGMCCFKKTFLEMNYITCDFRNCYLCIRCKITPTKDVQNKESAMGSDSYTWVCHAKTTQVFGPKVNQNETPKKIYAVDDDTEVTVKFEECSRSMQDIPKEICNKYQSYIIEVIPKSITDVRKEKAIEMLDNAPLAEDIALGYCDISRRHRHPVTEYKNFNIPDFKKLNETQTMVIKQSLTSTFTVIQGPPGTGKTVVGIHLIYWFHKVLKSMRESPRVAADKRICTLYCGPSNKSVDVVAEHAMKIKGLQVIRVYGQQTEEEEFPIPGESDVLCLKSKQVPSLNEKIRSIVLHDIIRKDTNPYACKIRKYDERIKILRNKKEQKEKRERDELEEREATQQSAPAKMSEDSDSSVASLGDSDKTLNNKEAEDICDPAGKTEEVKDLTPEEIKEYKELIKAAKAYELKKSDVIITTCSTAASGILLKNLDPHVCLIDECAMCTEPECLIPLTSYRDIKQVVLLGDHKQLRPFVLNQTAAKLGMERSMFERYAAKAVMLDTQYRMHPDICDFPSRKFYSKGDKNILKTADEVLKRPVSILGHAEKSKCPTLFGHVVGKESTLVVSTEEGSENSKANMDEVKHVVRIVDELIQKGSVAPHDIAILTPYNAQANEIQKALEMKGIMEVTATTITKSQGSEWCYVILSTVRSCTPAELDANPSTAWKMKKLGFIVDENQVNVAITRAKRGLCIIGNQHLLKCNSLWMDLFTSYKKKGCLVNAEKITVSSTRKQDSCNEIRKSENVTHYFQKHVP